MKLSCLLSLFVLQLPGFVNAQDTIRVEPSHFYSSIDEPLRGKEFASRVKYAREDIIFSDSLRKVEYCYYYDTERECFGDSYRLIGDSALQIGDSLYYGDIQTWTYRRLPSGKYFTYRTYDGVYESGMVSELMPFEPEGSFVTAREKGGDTLWIADYSSYVPRNPYDKPEWTYPTAKIKGKIYAMNKVDQLPTFLNGDSLPKVIEKERTESCIGEPYSWVKTMSFIVTTKGGIKNIKQEFGYLDMSWCPYYVMELMKTISQFGQLNPAARKGVAVNVKYIIQVDMTRQ